jgi:hypothetical protein
MSTRTSSTLALLLLAACGREAAEATPASTAAADDTISCALRGSDEFVRECAVQRVRTAGGLQLVVHHPDGGFRRFDVLTDGRGLATADGAQPARVTVFDDGIDVAVGEDRYRFPATIANHDGR